MLILGIIVLLAAIILPLVVLYHRTHRKVTITGTSVLLSYYTDYSSVMPLKNGMLGDMHYTEIATAPTAPGYGEASLIYQVLLPYASYVHLLGIPKKSGVVSLDPSGVGSVMERVDLEGDYSQRFDLFAEKGMQEDSRYVLDPKAMVFTIDFCGVYSWEIVDNLLFIVKSADALLQDPIDSADLITQFVAEIRPSIARPLQSSTLASHTPYSEEYRTNLKCPICQSILVAKEDYQFCPNGDGILLKGGVLTRLHAGTLTIPISIITKHTAETVAISCPSCGSHMEKVAFAGGKTIIDSCSSCPYRWLDQNDLSIQKS